MDIYYGENKIKNIVYRNDFKKYLSLGQNAISKGVTSSYSEIVEKLSIPSVYTVSQIYDNILRMYIPSSPTSTTYITKTLYACDAFIIGRNTSTSAGSLNYNNVQIYLRAYDNNDIKLKIEIGRINTNFVNYYIYDNDALVADWSVRKTYYLKVEESYGNITISVDGRSEKYVISKNNFDYSRPMYLEIRNYVPYHANDMILVKQLNYINGIKQINS